MAKLHNFCFFVFSTNKYLCSWCWCSEPGPGPRTGPSPGTGHGPCQVTGPIPEMFSVGNCRKKLNIAKLLNDRTCGEHCGWALQWYLVTQ